MVGAWEMRRTSGLAQMVCAAPTRRWLTAAMRQLATSDISREAPGEAVKW